MVVSAESVGIHLRRNAIGEMPLHIVCPRKLPVALTDTPRIEHVSNMSLFMSKHENPSSCLPIQALWAPFLR